MNNFKSTLIDMIKASGRDLINRAEEFVGDGEYLDEFDIRIDLGIQGGRIERCPRIEVFKSYSSKECFDSIVVSLDKEKENA